MLLPNLMAPDRDRTVVLRTVSPRSGTALAFGQMPSSATLQTECNADVNEGAAGFLPAQRESAAENGATNPEHKTGRPPIQMSIRHYLSPDV